MAIGTTAAIIGAAAIGGAASLASGAMGSSAANQAANVQAQAADRAAEAQIEAARLSAEVQREGLEFQKQTYEQSRADQMPWLEAGKTALGSYMGELGLSDEAKAGTFQSGFKETPGYQFAVQEGEKGVVNNLAALGMKNSGAALKALTKFRTGLADQTYGDYLNRLSGVAGTGQTASNTLGSLGQSVAGNVMAGMQGIGRTHEQAGAARASGYLNSGQARASGIVGSANAWGNALGGFSNTLGNALGSWAYGRQQNNGFPAAPSVGGIW